MKKVKFLLQINDRHLEMGTIFKVEDEGLKASLFLGLIEKDSFTTHLGVNLSLSL